MIREKTYRTKLDININISRDATNSHFSTNASRKQSRSFCYGVFLNGELRIVSSSTYTALIKIQSAAFEALLGKISEKAGLGFIIRKGDGLFDKAIGVEDTNTIGSRFLKIICTHTKNKN